MPYYRRMGDVPPKRHVLHPRPEGGWYAEELMGLEGFASSSALLYHRHSPSAVVAIEEANDWRGALHANLPLRPHHLRTGELAGLGKGDPVTGRATLLGNDDVTVTYVAATDTSPLYRNAVGDELAYVHAGRARLETVFGTLVVGAGDYVVVPMAATHRWVPEGGEPLHLYVLEAAGHVQPPARYLTAAGQFLEGAPYNERDLHGPSDLLAVEATDVEVLVRNRAGVSRHVYATHPFDVVGWDGYLYPYRFSIRDFQPIVGEYHQPPPVHQTFAGPGFVVCSFVPRPFDFGPGAVKIPYHHANVDSDEVLFYADGNFMSRAGSGIGVGSISLHPAGFVHGPQPGSLEASLDAERTGETAVMLDTFRPLLLGDAALATSDPEYPWTWARRPT